MNLSFFVAKRYLFAKKSHNAINIISGISLGGVAVGTAALIIILSVFNGFDEVVKSLFNSFYPEIKITAVEGKSFTISDDKIHQLTAIDEIAAISKVIEEDALLKYKDRYHLAIIKGVDKNFTRVTGFDTLLTKGEFHLQDSPFATSVLGQGVAYYLGLTYFSEPILIYLPRRTEKISYNPDRAFKKAYVYPVGVYQIEQDFDAKYIFVPIETAAELLDYDQQVTALELKLNHGENLKATQEQITAIMGGNFEVKNRLQQNEVFFKTMQSEKWVIFFILIFILLVASFNIIGSLTMLIIEKKKDIETFRSMGADIQTIRKVFLVEGWLISLIGAIIGLIIGSLVVFIQYRFGILQINSSGSFVIDAYPVKFVWPDLLAGVVTVVIIGYLAAWFPIRYISGKYIFGES